MRSSFKFGDRELERRYQEFYVSTCIDRIRPLAYFLYVPIVGTIILSKFLYGPRLGKAELILLGVRISILVIAIVLLSEKWVMSSKYRRGLFVLCLVRATVILAAIQQLGQSRDAQIMSHLVGYVFIGGLAAPSFAEYFLCSVFLTLLRPLYLSFDFSRSTSSTEAILSMLYQHTLILALGASIIWTVHADHRRDWLRSRSLLTVEPAAKRKNRSKLAKQDGSDAKAKCAAPSAESVEVSGTDEAQWDIVSDGCLHAADTHMLAQARQVHRSCLLHIRIQQNPLFYAEVRRHRPCAAA